MPKQVLAKSCEGRLNQCAQPSLTVFETSSDFLIMSICFFINASWSSFCEFAIDPIRLLTVIG